MHLYCPACHNFFKFLVIKKAENLEFGRDPGFYEAPERLIGPS